ncbi:DUF2651 family protein [Bacillus cereus]|uniref:DUF2651 family protein n=1 Tax=Bacillus cereus TaxID=1396 RepID=UPI0005394C0A
MIQLLINPMFLAMILFPVLIIVLSVIAYLKLKKIFIMPIIIFMLSILFMIVFANETFFVWVIIYTVLSLLVGLLLKYTNKTS